MKEPIKPLTGRQFLTAFRGSNRPCIAVDDSNIVRFLNPSAARLLEVDSEAVVGYDLNADVAAGGAPFHAGLHAWAKGTCSSSESSSFIPYSDRVASDQEKAIVGFFTVSLFDERWSGLRLFIGVYEDEPSIAQFVPNQTWIEDLKARQYIRSRQTNEYSLKSLASIFGPEPSSQLAMQQVQLAIESKVSICISGPQGGELKELGEAILHHRLRRVKTDEFPTVINAALVDHALLTEYLELATGRSTAASSGERRSAPFIVFHQLERLPLDCLSVLEQFFERYAASNTIVTTEAEVLREVHCDNTAWNNIVDKLSVIQIKIMPLNKRPADLFGLLREQLSERTQALGVTHIHGFSEAAMKMLRAYAWPSDVAELAATVEHAVRNCTNSSVQPEDLPLSVRTFSSTTVETKLVEPIDLDATLLSVEVTLLKRALDAFPRNRAAAARQLGISRARLLRRLDQLKIETPATNNAPVSQKKSTSTVDSSVFKPEDELVESEEIEAFESSDEVPVFREIPDDEEL